MTGTGSWFYVLCSFDLRVWNDGTFVHLLALHFRIICRLQLSCCTLRCVNVCAFILSRCYFSSCASFERLPLRSNVLITGDGLVYPLERGSTQPRHHSPGTLPAVHEATPVRALPVAADSRRHLPRRQARAVQGEVTSSPYFIFSETGPLIRHAVRLTTLPFACNVH